MFVFAPEVMWKILATIISGLFALVIFLLREYYSRIREQRQRKQNLQPLVNDVTIRLGEVAERVDELWERQWELPFRELPFSIVRAGSGGSGSHLSGLKHRLDLPVR